MTRNKVNQPGESGNDGEQETTELIGEESARCFLTQIHHNCPGRLEIRTIHPTTNSVRQYWPTTLDEAAAIAMKRSETESVYYGVTTRRNQSSGKKNNVSHFPGVWVDVDFKDFKGGEKEAWEKLDAFPLKPTIIVHTGGGLHLYFLLTESIPITSDLVLELEALNKAFVRALGGDGCHSLDHILRIPGTVNWPDKIKRQRGRVPGPVRLLVHEGPRYSLQQLQAAARSLPPKFLDLLKHNAKIKATWEGKRLDLEDDSRSGHDMSMTSQLVSHGFTDDEIIAILFEMPSGRGDEATGDYLRLTINTARQNQSRSPTNPTTSPADLADAYLRDRQLHSEEGLCLRWHRETWFRYNGMSYDPLPIYDLQADLTTYLQSSEARDKTTKTFVNNVLLNLQGICLIPSSVSLPVLETETQWVESPYTLVVDNGILDLQKLLDDQGAVILTPHSPRLVSTIALPFAYDLNAECSRWLAFLNEILPDEASRQLLCEIFGYCLTNDVSQQKFFLFEGIGANGKGVITSILGKMLGEANVSSIPLELFASTHGLEVTLGKLVNIVSEIGELDRVAEGLLKMFTGGDSMFFNPKYKTPFSAKPNAKLIITTNVRPPFRDRSEGIWRRLILLLFLVSIPETQQNKHLVEELAEELPGIFNWSVNGYHSLQQRGYFIEPPLSLEAKREFRLECNPAQAFLQDHCVADPIGKIESTDLYREYSTFCNEHGYKPLNNANFGKEVRRVFPSVERIKLCKKDLRMGRIKPGGKSPRVRPWGYRGLSLLPQEPISTQWS
jgi:putative DNA primase/helicase